MGQSADYFRTRIAGPELINAFAEYLDEHHVAPEILRLYHPSLRARLLLLELKRLLSESK